MAFEPLHRGLGRPTVGRWALAAALIIVLGLAACTDGGEGDGAEDDTQPVAVDEQSSRHDVPVEYEPNADGQSLFENNCAACHQRDGSGAGDGVILPLSPSAFVTIDDPEPLITTVLYGRAGMPRFGDQLDDEQLAAILTHIRQLGENEASEITAEQVAAVREEVDGSQDPEESPEAEETDEAEGGGAERPTDTEEPTDDGEPTG